jgi:hypothetical protein
MKYVNIDFDDAGRGPFVLDFQVGRFRHQNTSLGGRLSGRTRGQGN